ncbi:hypothetical protein NEOLEDRAFT_1080078, partial [Neolentinus lepideus HHB14362 ss-1]
IIKAQWIKLVMNHRPGQEVAHSLFHLQDPKIANMAIDTGIVISDREINEPIACMKCQQYRHLAKACPRDEEVCGMCRDNHRTAMYMAEHVFCINCGAGDHPSTRQEWPIFLKNQDLLNAQ